MLQSDETIFISYILITDIIFTIRTMTVVMLQG